MSSVRIQDQLSARWQISPYTRRMQRREVFIKALLGLCALLVIGFLLVLIGYLSFRGLFIRKDIESAVLPDYRQSFAWPARSGGPTAEPSVKPAGGQSMNLWLSAALELGKLRADQLHDILAGKEKNWVELAESEEKLVVLLTQEQLDSLERANRLAGKSWSKSRNIKVQPDYPTVARALLQEDGGLAILPDSWTGQQWRDLQEAAAQSGGADAGKRRLPRRASLAQQSLLLSPKLATGLLAREEKGRIEILEAGEAGQGSEAPGYRLSLAMARELLAASNETDSVHTADYNWLSGTVGGPPILLRYRDYEYLKISFLLEPPAKNGKVGGIATMLLSSLLLILLSLLWAVPLGLAVAVFLVEYAQSGGAAQSKWQNRFARTVNIAIQTLSGIPSIIFGLFGSILFVPLLGIGLLSGAATLVLMLLPTIILTAKEALLTVPRSYIEGSLGLGAQKWYTILHISLPSALPGILAGIILAIGRALGETAALIYTLGTGYQAALSRFPQLLADWPAVWQNFWLAPGLGSLARIIHDYPLLDLHSSLRSISLHLYWMTINGISLQKGFSTAFVLIFLIVLLNMGARALLSRFSSRHQALS